MNVAYKLVFGPFKIGIRKIMDPSLALDFIRWELMKTSVVRLSFAVIYSTTVWYHNDINEECVLTSVNELKKEIM